MHIYIYVCIYIYIYIYVLNILYIYIYTLFGQYQKRPHCILLMEYESYMSDTLLFMVSYSGVLPNNDYLAVSVKSLVPKRYLEMAG